MRIAEKASKRTRKQIELSLRFKDRMWDVYEENKHLYPEGFNLALEFSKKYSMRQWYRLFELGNNPTFYTICGLAEILFVPPSTVLDFDFNKKIKKVSKHPFWEIENGWNLRHF
jgi:hypothetical protein